jgi:hypothetical protein
MKLKLTDENGSLLLNIDEPLNHELKEKVLWVIREHLANTVVLIHCVKLNADEDYFFINKDYYLLKDQLDYLKGMDNYREKTKLDVSISFHNTLREAVEISILMYNQF